MREKIIKLLESNGDLPPLPDIVVRLQKVIHDPGSNARSIAKLIEVDPVLAGRILQLSNSTYYSRSTNPIKTLPVAITKIGTKVLVKLVYSLKFITLFNDSSILDQSSFWRHSLAVAIFTQSLSRRIKATREEQDIAYLSGLMHDIGIMVFCYLIPDEYIEFLRRVQDEEVPLEVREYKKFGIDHTELGAVFIKKWWQVDDHILQAVRYHHFPFVGLESDKRCEQMVHIANGICSTQGITNGVDSYNEAFKEGAWEELGLSLTDVENILQDVNTSLDQAKELMNLSVHK